MEKLISIRVLQHAEIWFVFLMHFICSIPGIRPTLIQKLTCFFLHTRIVFLFDLFVSFRRFNAMEDVRVIDVFVNHCDGKA